VTFPTEVTVPVDVEVLDYTPASMGRYGDRPEQCVPAEPEALELAVRLGGLDVTQALPVDVLEALRAEALEQLFDP